MTGVKPPVAILGCGSLGTALAAGLWRKGRDFTLWTIEDDVAESLETYQENVKYLPGIKISKEVRVTTDLEAALHDAQLVILAVPSHVVREVARRAAPFITAEAVLVSVAKGLERESLLRMSQVIAEEVPDPLKARIVVVSGPSLAGEVGAGRPAGVDVACDSLDLARFVRSSLQMKSFRFKLRRDMAGVEAGGTLKNLYAIGAGLCDGLELGGNAKAALITRALAEMVLCARKLGGKASTLMGLSGLGDLMVTCTSAGSRNRTLGEQIARGRKVAEISRGMVSVTEGVEAAHCVHDLSEKQNLRVPLAETIYRIIGNEAKPESITKALLP